MTRCPNWAKHLPVPIRTSLRTTLKNSVTVVDGWLREKNQRSRVAADAPKFALSQSGGPLIMRSGVLRGGQGPWSRSRIPVNSAGDIADKENRRTSSTGSAGIAISVLNPNQTEMINYAAGSVPLITTTIWSSIAFSFGNGKCRPVESSVS